MNSLILFIITFCIGMAGSILRKNIIMSLLCLFIANLSAVMILTTIISLNALHGEKLVAYFILISSLPFSIVGVVLIMNFFRTSKTIMNEEMKSWVR